MITEYRIKLAGHEWATVIPCEMPSQIIFALLKQFLQPFDYRGKVVSPGRTQWSYRSHIAAGKLSKDAGEFLVSSVLPRQRPNPFVEPRVGYPHRFAHEPVVGVRRLLGSPRPSQMDHGKPRG